MKSYIKLFGPSIDKGLEALNQLMKELRKRYQYGDMVSHIVSVIDPTIDLMTGTLIDRGFTQLGDFDFVIEWQQTPTPEQVRMLIRRIDEALLYTGCMYRITTKQ